MTQMALPHNDRDLCTSPSEALASARESMDATGLLQGPFLWESLFECGERALPMPGDRIRMFTVENWVEWWGEKLKFLGQLCEMTNLGGSRSEFTQDIASKMSVIVNTKFSPDAVAHCLHVACVTCLNCTLLSLKIQMRNYEDTASVIARSGLRDEMMRLFEKWRWDGKSWGEMFKQWIHSVSINDAAIEKEIVKLLYQWTHLPLIGVLGRVQRVMDSARGDHLTGIKLVSTWGDEICNFLKEYRTLLSTTNNDTEFLYGGLFLFHRTALLHRTLGNEKRSKELLETIKNWLEDIQEYDLKVVEWKQDPMKIAFCEPNPVTLLAENLEVYSLLTRQGEKDDDFRNKISYGRKDLFVSSGLSLDNCCYTLGWNITRYGSRIDHIVRLTGFERYSEASEYFKACDFHDDTSNALFRDFLEGILSYTQEFISHSCSGMTLSWESVCKKMDLLLEFCEALRDLQLTAKFSEHYAIMHGFRSLKKLVNISEEDTIPTLKRMPEKGDSSCSLIQGDAHAQEDIPASRIRLWLKEELCVQEAISCLSDPWQPDEHKHKHLPDALKAIRLHKRSIDIYSDFLHDWTGESSNEVEWLKLVESQKSAHNSLLTFLQFVVTYCTQLTDLHSTPDSLSGADDELGSNYLDLDVPRALAGAVAKFMLVWTERGRARTLLKQLGPWYNLTRGDGSNPGALKRELMEFDKNEETAMSSILSCQSACNAKALFVEYTGKTLCYEKVMAYTGQTLRDETAMAFTIGKDSRALEETLFDFRPHEVEKLVDEFYKKVEEFQTKKPMPRRLDAAVKVQVDEILEKLYDILIKPLASGSRLFEQLDSKDILVFVPDKILYRVPFALLRHKNEYLFQLHPIAIAPSLRVLQHCERRLRDLDSFPLKPEGCVLAVGNAAYMPPTVRLPGTAKELEHLRSCFPGRVKSLEEEEATRANFLELVKEASHSKEQHVFASIHLGVHGYWSKFNLGAENTGEVQLNLTGSLRFAKSPRHTGGSKDPIADVRGDHIGSAQPHTSVLEQKSTTTFEAGHSCSDGERHGRSSAFGEVGAVTRAEGYTSDAAADMLPSEDIVCSGFQWRTRLVVLSACNSSRGQDYNDGEVNLPRALMIAGVPAAVVSQWKVSDVGSPMLMKLFYENMQCGLDVATALQSAMKQLSSDPESESANNIFEWGPFLVWGLPTVKLPMELMTEHVRKTIHARERAEFLRCKLAAAVESPAKVFLLETLKVVETFLESASCNRCAFETDPTINAIVAIETLLRLREHPDLSVETLALVEEFYKMLLFEEPGRIELELERRGNVTGLFDFRMRMMYTLAMKDSPQIALDYADKLLEVIQNDRKSIVQNFGGFEPQIRQERAVIWRLMGKYDEALKEFHDLLDSSGEDYERLIQASYLKDLMGDKRGALEYARRAKKVQGDKVDAPGRGAFILSFKALPDEYRSWLLNKIDVKPVSSSMSWDPLSLRVSGKGAHNQKRKNSGPPRIGI